MSTINDQPGEAEDASDQPVPAQAATPDLEKIVQMAVAAATEAGDKRIAGLQSMFDRKLGALERQLKTSGLTEEQREQLDAEEEATELARLRMENELFRNSEKFPKAAPILRKLAETVTLEDQLALIEEAFAAGEISSAQADAAENAVVDAAIESAGDPVPQVDRTNPSRPVVGGRVAAQAGEMTDELADAILATGGPGALRGGR